MEGALTLGTKVFEGPSFEVYEARWQKYRGDLIVKVYKRNGITSTECLLKEAIRQASLRTGSMTLIDVMFQSLDPQRLDGELTVSFVLRKNWANIPEEDLQRCDDTGQPHRGLELYGVLRPRALKRRKETFSPPQGNVVIKTRTFLFADNANDFLREACIQAAVAHERNRSLFDICIDKERPEYHCFRLHLVYEKMEVNVEDDIIRRLNYNQPCTEKELLIFLRDVSEGLAHAKKMVMPIQKIAHRNIKPSKIFIKNERYKIGGFCSAKLQMIGAEYFGKNGSIGFLSPERSPNYSNFTIDVFMSDIYSLGVTMLHLAALTLPLEPTEKAIQDAIHQLGYSFEFKNLLEGMTQSAAELRLELSQITKQCEALL